MIAKIKGIDNIEYVQLKDAIALITVLIAGADGDIDTKEKDWAKKVTDIRSYTLPDGLKEFYIEVGKNLQERVDHYVEVYKGDIDTRNQGISARLALLNDILPKIENKELSMAIYESLLSFAKHVARASGGFMKWGGISSKEEKLMNLDMIHPPEEV